MECSVVLPRLYVGSCPESTQDIARLRSEYQVTAVLTLQSDADHRLYNIDWQQLRASYEQWNIEVHQAPIQDNQEEDLTRQLTKCVKRLNRLLEQGHTVFVHCNIGNGRSPTVVAAWLSWVGNRDLEAAAEHVRRCRKCEPNLNVIRAAEKSGEACVSQKRRETSLERESPPIRTPTP